MAELPKYQQTGRIFADVPQLDFANVRESFKRSQSIANSLDRLSEFAGKFAKVEVEKKAQQFNIDNPITVEQLREAQKTGITAEDLIQKQGGGLAWNEIARKIQSSQLRNQLEVEANTSALQIKSMVDTNQITDANEVKAKFMALQDGMSKQLFMLDPDEASRFQTSTGALIKNLQKESYDKLYDNYKLANQVKAGDYKVVALESIDAALRTENDPEKFIAQRSLIRQTYANLAKEGGADFAIAEVNKLDNEINQRQINYFEDYAIKNSVKNNEGLPDIGETMKSISLNNLGEKSALWNSLPQDEKNKVSNNIYAKLTQNYSAYKAQQLYIKEQNEIKYTNVALDLLTPNKITGPARISTARMLAEKNVITKEQYKELIDDKPKGLTPNQEYIKNYARYEIAIGSIRNITELQSKYGNKLPINHIGDLLIPLSNEDAREADKYMNKYSGAEYDPQHLQPTTQKKWIQITNKTDEMLMITENGERRYKSKLEASKAAAQAIDNSRDTANIIRKQKRLWESLDGLGFNPDNGGLEQFQSKFKSAKLYNDYLQEYNSYMSAKKQTRKSYNQLPPEEDLKAMER